MGDIHTMGAGGLDYNGQDNYGDEVGVPSC